MKNYSKILTKEFLYKEYITNQNSAVIIAKIIDCSATVLYSYLRKYKIKIRTLSEMQIGSKNHAFKGDGAITNKKYYCKNCDKKIDTDTYLYKSKLCSSCCKKGKKHSELHKKNISIGNKGKHCGQKCYFYKNGNCINKPKCITCGKELISYYAKNCLSCSQKLKWQDKEFRERNIKAMFESMLITPNKPEQLLIKLLPKTYKFVGNGKLIVGGFCPDFVNKGNNRIIEMYGDYWHNKPEVIKRDKRRIIAYKKYGYKTLIIWEKELKDLKKVKNRIKEFNNVFAY